MGGCVIRQASMRAPLSPAPLSQSQPLRFLFVTLYFITFSRSSFHALRLSLVSAPQLWNRWDNEVIQHVLALLRPPFQRCLIAKAGGGATEPEMGQLGWKMAGLHPGLERVCHAMEYIWVLEKNGVFQQAKQ